MDLATGSAGFLISAMEIMRADAELHGAKGSPATEEKIRTIKRGQLGVELNAEMYTLAATNMILRGDGSSKIHKANTFNTPPELYKDFAADRLLLNPPFSFEENGMPFIRFGLDNMQKGGLGAIIIQDSAGSGKAVKTNKEILKRHTLKASIKMPGHTQPMAGVQTSIYIFEAGTPHDFEQSVKFMTSEMMVISVQAVRCRKLICQQNGTVMWLRFIRQGSVQISRLSGNWMMCTLRIRLAIVVLTGILSSIRLLIFIQHWMTLRKQSRTIFHGKCLNY
ncbi:class I SAM-dependent DNA methyltransferase [Escherichia coli]